MSKNPIERLQETLLRGDKKLAALVFSERNRRYFTHFPATDGALLITAEQAYLLMDFRYEEAARYQAEFCEVVGFQDLNGKLNELLQKHGVKRVYLEIDQLSVAQARRFQASFSSIGAEAVLDEKLDGVIRQQRMIKSRSEVKKIEAAQEITDAAFQHILPFIKEGVTERELALEIEFFMRKNGAENVAFDLIVAAGKNGSQCHAVPSSNPVKKGDFVTMDTGALLDGYHSDMTRTVALGKVSDEQRQVYETVLQAHLAVIDGLKPGILCCDVDKIARDMIDEKYPGTFGHGLGHGVGFEIHESPRFSSLDTTPCAEGMVITDEPGIYVPAKYGVRIEDMLLVTSNGCRSLTKSPKELMEL
ncbi:MAG: aminopeptidase P family protein [Acutalibacter sp.]|nr:aminopeptidase P family protein [Acutalibacter sp.]